MHLMYHSQPDGTRLYTLKKVEPGTGRISKSAHPGQFAALVEPFCFGSRRSNSPLIFCTKPAARFSPDDKFSRHRVTIKKRCEFAPSLLLFSLASLLTRLLRLKSTCTLF